MTESLIIRPAAAGDTEAVLRLVPRLLDFGPPEWRDRAEMARADLQVMAAALARQTTDRSEDAAEAADAAIFVAELDGAVAGFVHVHAASDFYRRRPHAHVADLAVDPAAEGRGVATRLLAEAESWARQQGHDWMSISVFETNGRAAGLYEHLGFRRDTLRMVRPLD